MDISQLGAELGRMEMTTYNNLILLIYLFLKWELGIGRVELHLL